MIKLVEFPQFVGPSYRYGSLPVDCQESINLEAVAVESPSSPYKSKMIGTPGTKRLYFKYQDNVLESLPTGLHNGVIRGVHKTINGFGMTSEPCLVVVAGKYVWQVKKPALKPTMEGGRRYESEIVLLMEIPSGTSPNFSSRVSMVDAGGESGSNKPPKFVIADGDFYHVINMDDYSTSTIGVQDAPQHPTKLTYLDGRVYSCGLDRENGFKSGHVYWSAINDPSSWEQLDFISASVTNDPVVSVNTVGNNLWILGTETFEVWQTTSGSSAPIRKVNGAAEGVGAVSADSVATIGGNIFFLGSGELGRCRIYHGRGIGANYISTDAIEEEIGRYKDLEKAFGFCYSDEGRTYYVITFPYDDVTWVYNLESKGWHKRSTNDGDNRFHMWRNCDYANLWNISFVAMYDTANMMVMDSSFYDDDGKAIIRKRTSPHIVSQGHDIRHASFEIDVECGVGLNVGQGSDPQIMLRAYDNGGRTPREERWRTIGKMGAYRTRVKWMRLGHGVDRVYEIKMSDPVKWTIYGARTEVEDPEGGR